MTDPKNPEDQELSLNQLQGLSGGNSTDDGKKKEKDKLVAWACTEKEDCPNNDTFESSGSKLKKSSKPIPYTHDVSDEDGWQTER